MQSVPHRPRRAGCIPRATWVVACLSAPLWAWAEAGDRLAPLPAATELGRVEVSREPLPFRQFDKIEITGSSIVRKEQTQSLPVQLVTQAEIQKSSKQNLGEFLQSLPVMLNAFSPAVLGVLQSGFSGGAIHGLQTGTLVLVNGRRVAGFGRQTSFGPDNGGSDLNALPLSAIDRIEILTDGASSVYGTDAQTGVINIITRPERRGVEITADHRSPDGRKGLASRVDLSVGGGRLRQDGYNWYMAAELQEQQELMGRDRPYASAGRFALRQDQQDYWVYGFSLSAAQTSTTLSGASTDGKSRLWNAEFRDGQCPQGLVPAWGQSACLYTGYPDKGLYPASRSSRLHAQGRLQLDADLTAYAELSWQDNAQTRTYDSWRTYSARIGNGPQYPGYDLAVANGFDPARGVRLLFSGSVLGAAPRWYDLETRRLAVGLKGQWQHWDFNTGYFYSDNRAAFSVSGFAPYPNLGVDSSGVLVNPALLRPLTDDSDASRQLREQLLGMQLPRTSVNAGSNRLQGLDLKASRSVGEIDGRDVLLALGIEGRQETAAYDNFVATGIPSHRGQRTVLAQFVELQMPLPRDLETIASLRNDHYSDFGATTHGKLTAKWAPNPQWLVRGAWGSSFRAPAVAQMQDSGKSIVGTTTSTCTPDLQEVASRLQGSCPSDGVYALYSSGSSQLKPELSRQLNFGLRFTPSRNHTMSADYWRIDMRDRINNPTSDVVIGDPVKYLKFFELGPSRQLQIYTPMINMGRSQTAGIDFSWNYRKPLSWGQLNLGVSGTRLLLSRFQRADGEPFVSDLDTYSENYGVVVPKLKTRWSAGLNQASRQWLLTVQHVGSHDGGGTYGTNAQTGNATVLQYRVPAWWTMDVSMTQQWGSRTQLRLGIDNLFNRNAPMSFVMPTTFNFGTDPNLANVWGRTLHLSVTHRL